MKKIARIFVVALLGSAVGLLSFGITTVLSSAFIQTTAAENNEAAAINDAIRDVAALAPSINPAANPQYESVDYGFTYLTYRIKRGDNLTDIARRHSGDLYKISADEIRYLNGIKNPNRILAGQKLQLPVYYAKEVQAVMPVTVQAAVEAAVAPKEAALINTKRGLFTVGGGAIVIIILLHILYVRNIRRIETFWNNLHSAENPEPEKFLTYPDEITALLQRCTGRDVAAILESELVEVPRNPGSAVMNKKKLMNLKDLMHNNPELYDMPLEQWSAHLAEKMNEAAPASAKST